jgi:hypothetical protein
MIKNEQKRCLKCGAKAVRAVPRCGKAGVANPAHTTPPGVLKHQYQRLYH